MQDVIVGENSHGTFWSVGQFWPNGLWTTRRQTNSPTDQLANNPARRQTNSPTNKLAEIDIMTFRATHQPH